MGGKQGRQTLNFACFRMAWCKTLWVGGKQSKAGKLASLPALVEPMRDARVGWESCLGIARCKTSWFGGSKAGKLASLPALGKRDARRSGWACSNAGKLPSLPAFAWRGAGRDGCVGSKQANWQVCLRWYGAMPEAMVGRGGKAGKPARLPFRAMRDGMVGWAGRHAILFACRKVACRDIGRCKV